jgi:archaellum component FlaC
MVAFMAVMARERWTDERLDKAFGRIDGDLRELRVEIKNGFEQVDKQFGQVDKQFEQVDKRLQQVDKRFDQVDKRFEQVDKRFEQIDKRFERFEDKIDGLQQSMTTWFIGLSFSIIGSLVAALFLG